MPIAPSRGMIYDRNGTPLAFNRTIYQLEVIPEKVEGLQEQIAALGPIVDLSADDLDNFQKERKRSRRFTSIPLKTALNEVQVARFAVNQFRFPGFEVKGYQRRYYPYGSALTHVIGYVSKINDKDVERLDKEGNWPTTPPPMTSASWASSATMRMCCTARPVTKRSRSITVAA